MKNFLFTVKSNLSSYNFLWKFKVFWCLPLIMILIILDWITKAVAVNKLVLNGPQVNFLPGIVNFQYVINTGAAYGMNAENKSLAIAIASVVTIFLIGIFIFLKNKYYLISVNLMVSGSIANLLGRAWAPETSYGEKGGVVDMLKFDFSFLGSDNYIFNLADAWVSISVAIIVVTLCVVIGLEIYSKVLKNKNLEKYELYIDFKNKKIILFESFYEKFKIDDEEKLTYRQYIKRNKEINLEWKNNKTKEVNDG